MIFGHLGVAAIVRATQRDPHGTRAFVLLCVAAVLPDVLDVLFATTGVCSPYGLYTHTIPAIVLETAIVGGLAWLVTGSPGLAFAFAVVMPLHLTADFITMHKLVIPGGELHGMDLYQRPILDFLVEAPLFVLGWWILRRSARGPWWSVTGAALAVVLIFQGGFDAYQQITHKSIKPNACYRVSAALNNT